jgi:hypothetical protein
VPEGLTLRAPLVLRPTEHLTEDPSRCRHFRELFGSHAEARVLGIAKRAIDRPEFGIEVDQNAVLGGIGGQTNELSKSSFGQPQAD